MAKTCSVNLRVDILHLAFSACQERCGYDITALEKWEQDRIFTAILDAWTDWPIYNESAWNAAVETLQSLAVAGGWEEYLS